MSVSDHLEKAKTHIAVAESADSKQAAYEAAADEIIAAQAEDPTLTQRQIGERIGKDQRWIRTLLKWHEDGHTTAAPFSNKEAYDRYRERKVPTRHEDRVEMATKLLADPEVVKAAAPTVLASSSKAGRLLTQAVHDRDAEERRKRAEQERQAALDKALPLPAYMAKMVEKMNEWSGSLAALEDDLAELPEGRGRELVSQAAENLAVRAQRWVSILADVPELDEGGVIEGEVVLRIG